MRRWTDLALAALLGLTLGGAASAQDIGIGMPSSASDWLSGKAPPRTPPTAWRPGDPRPTEAERRRPLPPPARPATRAKGTGAGVAETAAVPRVGVTRLSNGNPDAKGAVPAGAAGLPRDLWGAAAAGDIAAALGSAQPRLAATRALLVRMLTAQLDAPTGTPGGEAGTGDEGRLFLARTDRLIALGLVPEAEALARAAGTGSAEGFARRFDAALYQGDATEVCQLMADRPGLAPDLAARAYCLAQAGDWPAAALTLHGARDAGLIPPQTVALLERFLDDSSADLAEALPDPRAVSPLEFRLFEAIGQPLATSQLPLPFAWSDLGGDAGWKAEIEAAERLARAGAIDPARLAAAYAEQKPAASGGIWDRAAAYQRLDAALGAGDGAALAEALPDAERRFAEAGLLPALARLVAVRLPAAGLDGPAAESAAHLRLLAGVPVPGAARLPEADRALVQLAEGHPAAAAPAADGDGADADGTAPPAPPAPAEPAQASDTRPAEDGPAPPPYSDPAYAPGSPGAAYAAALRTAPDLAPPPQGRGLALLAALADVEAGLDGDTARAAGGLAALTRLGQPETARRAAVELLLTDHLGGPRR